MILVRGWKCFWNSNHFLSNLRACVKKKICNYFYHNQHIVSIAKTKAFTNLFFHYGTYKILALLKALGSRFKKALCL